MNYPQVPGSGEPNAIPRSGPQIAEALRNAYHKILFPLEQQFRANIVRARTYRQQQQQGAAMGMGNPGPSVVNIHLTVGSPISSPKCSGWPQCINRMPPRKKMGRRGNKARRAAHYRFAQVLISSHNLPNTGPKPISALDSLRKLSRHLEIDNAKRANRLSFGLSPVRPQASAYRPSLDGASPRPTLDPIAS